MSCVGACPAGALQDGQGAPLLRFIEKNCVQCGLCAATCPENAITLQPRLSFLDSRKQAVVLNESQPFHCIRCDKPFGTLQMVENMLGRLASHPAFSGHLDRLRMCGDCRVIDMMAPEGEMRVTALRRD
jgi:ferredoxin